MPVVFAFRLLATFIAAASSFVALTADTLAQQPQRAAPARDAGPPTLSYIVAGLDKPAEILVDQWGVPHIYAKSPYDAFFVQGFNAARDRLWQIDLWRRRGLGTLSEVFGASTVARDHAARLFLFRGDLYREWLAYGPDTKRIAEAFVAGINAYVKLTAQNPDLLPLEFRMLDYKPSLWNADDLVRIRAHGAWGNLKSEVRRAQLGCIAGLQADLSRRSLEPAQVPKIPDGIDLCEVRDDVVALYRLATSDIAFVKSDSTASPTTANAAQFTAQFTVVPVEPSETVAADSERGSAVVVAARLSASGKPLAAFDLHDPRRVHALPAPRYAAHLSAPGLNAIGAGDPFLPGIIAGHNDRIAWGATRFPIDQEDLYVETLSADGSSVKWMDQWSPVAVVDETVAVRGAATVKVALKFTRHGPIVFEDSGKSRAFAIRAGWLDPGMAPFMASLGVMRAQNWEQFLAAMNGWGGPPASHTYADIDGTIGWKPAGLAPVRRNYDGLLPVPGDGRYEWAGFADMDQLAQEINPARGWIAEAGQSQRAIDPADRTDRTERTERTDRADRANLGVRNDGNETGDRAMFTYRPGFEWSPRWRFERIAELLERPEKKTAQDLFAMHSDALSVPARRIVLLLKDTQTQDLRVSEAISLLRNWDFRLTPESPAAALFQVWYDRHLAPGILSLRTPPGAAKLIDVADSTVILALLEVPAAKPQRDALFVGTLRQAIADMEQRQGNNWLRWSWGALHRMEFAHPLSALQSKDAAQWPAPALRQRGGGAFTVSAAPYRGSTLQVTGAASLRMVFDLGNWDNALAVHAPGQSGDPRSKHYADLLELWSKDASYPLLYSRGAIEKATELKIVLNPAPQ